MPPLHKIPETYFEILFNILLAQNKRLLTELAVRYELPISMVLKDCLPTRAGLRAYLREQANGE